MNTVDFNIEQSVVRVRDYLMQLQDHICRALEEEDGKAIFYEDHWKSELGYGRTHVLTEGDVFEQAGVNFSNVFGKSLPLAATVQRPELAGCPFHATGVSLVLHPKNPYVPTTHMNVRLFAAENSDGKAIWWFGGGYDLTPYYGFDEDCYHWHATCKKTCDAFGKDYYSRFKKAADNYFYLKHRKEPRGIGGIFFDDFNELTFAQCFSFLKQVGESFLQAYLPIVRQRKQLLYGDRERQFQLYRRGRYVEFNLVYDRGTHFGLQFGGRTESILMSLPPLVRWQYHYQPEPNTPEARLVEHFLKPQDWV